MSRYVLAKYIRLSAEDFDTGENGKDESNSVMNQRNLLDDFITRTPDFLNCEILEFCDDGWSGTNFNRPRIQELLKLAEAGKIHCVVVQDLSRFGRNHIEVGDYLEQKLPDWGVRFISVNDAFDSNKYRGITGGIDIAFRNLIYDLYSRDLSEKIRSSRITQAKKGKYFSPYAFYGYIKDKADKHRLLIDEEAAQIVRQMYELADQGLSTTEIARKLNTDNIPTPQMRKKAQGVKRRWHMNGERNFWERGRVRGILGDERYTGKMVSLKQRRYEVGKVQSELLSRDEWAVVPDIFPPIITEDQFARVQERLRRGNSGRNGTMGKDILFYRKIKCGCCKKAMRRGNTRGTNPSYSCDSKSFVVGLSCVDGHIPEWEIAETVLNAIQQQAAFADGARLWMEKNAKSLRPEIDLCHAKIEELQVAIQKKGVAKMNIWERQRDGLLSKEDFVAARDKLSAQIAAHEDAIKHYEGEILRLQTEGGRENRYVERFFRHTGIQKLTRDVVDELIHEIHIHDRNRIEIVFNYADEYASLIAEMDAANIQEVYCGTA